MRLPVLRSLLVRVEPVPYNAPRLRGFTCYPDGARGGQPLLSVPYQEAVSKLGQEFAEGEEALVENTDVCVIGKGGVCGE